MVNNTDVFFAFLFSV